MGAIYWALDYINNLAHSLRNMYLICVELRLLVLPNNLFFYPDDEQLGDFWYDNQLCCLCLFPYKFEQLLCLPTF